MGEKSFESKEVPKHNPMEIVANNMILEFEYQMGEVSPRGEDTREIFRFQPQPKTETGVHFAPTIEILETFQRHLIESLKYTDMNVAVTVETIPTPHIKMELDSDENIDESENEA